ncbi:MAG: squalene synthase HpnC [Rhodospirillales bacterium]|nr:squalene synthase HpnC [Rhodospirillales bacterium]
MTDAASETVETPSGKDAAYENFPVGSWLLPAPLRPHIAAFYAFARAIDDIADSPVLSAEDKVMSLQGFEDVLVGRTAASPAFLKAARLKTSLADTGITAQHGVDLIAAFKQDAIKLRYRDWDDLLGYCILSAAPVGRYLLDLHGGSSRGYAASDALCMALQVLNHLQDCQDDFRSLNRVYLPLEWMTAAGAKIEDLEAGVTAPPLRRVLDHLLDSTDGLIAEAQALPGGLRSRRLAMESAVIIRIAEKLSTALRRRDPLAGRVVLSKSQYLWCCLGGVVSVLAGRT